MASIDGLFTDPMGIYEYDTLDSWKNSSLGINFQLPFQDFQPDNSPYLSTTKKEYVPYPTEFSEIDPELSGIETDVDSTTLSPTSPSSDTVMMSPVDDYINLQTPSFSPEIHQEESHMYLPYEQPQFTHPIPTDEVSEPFPKEDPSPYLFKDDLTTDPSYDHSDDSISVRSDEPSTESSTSETTVVEERSSKRAAMQASPFANSSKLKKRGRPKMNKSAKHKTASPVFKKVDESDEDHSSDDDLPTPSAGRQKRKAETIAPESLFGTKKSKQTGGPLQVNILDRLPSTLSDEELQSLSSVDYDTYMKAVFSKLSRTEQELAKKQRRRIKNRESAENSRRRKQNNLEELDKQVEQLRAENNRLRFEAEKISTQKDAITRELEQYKRLVVKHFPSGLLPPFFTSGNNSEYEEVSTKTSKKQSSFTNAVSRHHTTVSASLLCIVLFALFIGVSRNNGGHGLILPSSAVRSADLPLQGSTTWRLDSPTPFMSPVSSSLSSTFSAQSTWINAISRAMSKHSEDTRKEIKVLESAVNEQVTHSFGMDGSPVSIITSAKQDLDLTNVPFVDSRIDSTTSSSTKHNSEDENKPTSSMPQEFNPEWKQNTTYLMCNDMQQVIPPSGAQPEMDPNAPLFISLWVQPSTLEGSPIVGGTGSSKNFNGDYFVQISCQIVGVDTLGLLTSRMPKYTKTES